MAQMNTDFSSGPLDYSSAEFKRIPLKNTDIIFFEHKSHESNEYFHPDQNPSKFYLNSDVNI